MFFLIWIEFEFEYLNQWHLLLQGAAYGFDREETLLGRLVLRVYQATNILQQLVDVHVHHGQIRGWRKSYHKISSIRNTKLENLNVSCFVLQNFVFTQSIDIRC